MKVLIGASFSFPISSIGRLSLQEDEFEQLSCCSHSYDVYFELLSLCALHDQTIPLRYLTQYS